MLVGLPDHGLTTCPIDRPRHEVLPAIAGGHGDEQSEQVDVGPDPRHQAVTALALGSGRGTRNLTRTTSKKNSLSKCQPMCLGAPRPTGLYGQPFEHRPAPIVDTGRARFRASCERLKQISQLGVAMLFHEPRHIVDPTSAARLANDR
jgi:hypothetical protein